MSGDPATAKWSAPAVGQNAVFAATPGAHVRIFGKSASAAACQSACVSDGVCNVWTWHDKVHKDPCPCCFLM